MKHIIYIFGAFGFFLLVGTAGALDCDNISITQGVIQYMIGGACFIPAVLYKIKHNEEVQKNDRT